MPNNLNAAEQLFYLSLRCLYNTYTAGKINKDTARKEKSEIYKTYDLNALNLACYEALSTRFNKLAILHHKLKDSGCELCREYVDILTGG
jgi:hypothetical protein